MPSFIEQFYEDVDANLNDPTTSKRTNKSAKLRLLHSVDRAMWERVMLVSGQESMPGYAETIITIENEKEFYSLPATFRQFYKMQLIDDDGIAISQLNSIQFYDTAPGVLLLSQQRGMRIRPLPSLKASLDWTLQYQRSAGQLHFATAKSATETTLTAGTPSENAGSLLLLPAYYNGAMLRVYEADTGADQVREIKSWDHKSKTFILRHPWGVTPTGTIKYEIRPTLPPEYEDLYAMDVAIRLLGRRGRGRQLLKEDRKALWEAALGYYVSNTADRGPTRPIAIREASVDPYEDT